MKITFNGLVLAALAFAVSATWGSACPPQSQEEQFKQLVKDLLSKDTKTHVDAARALRAMGPKAEASAPMLLEALRDAPDARERSGIPGTLGEVCRSRPALLVKALQDPSPKVRSGAAHALWYMGKDATSAVPELVKLCGDPDKEVRIYANRALGGIGDESAIPALIKSLADDDLVVSDQATTALVEFGPKARDAVPVLMQMIRSQSSTTWQQAEALAAIGGAAIPEVQKLLVSRSADLNHAGLYILEKMGPLAEFALDDVLRFSTDESDEYRRMVAQIVINIGPPARKESLPVLKKMLSDPSPWVVVKAMNAVKACDPEGEEITQSIIKMLKQGSRELRWELLGELADHTLEFSPSEYKQLVNVMIDLYRTETNVDIKTNIMYFFQYAGPSAKDALPIIREAMRDGNERLRGVAENAEYFVTEGP